MIPADTVVLAGVKFDALRSTPVWQKLVAAQKVPALDRIAEDTGLDPRRDISEMLVASDGKHTVILAHGKFPNTAALEKKLMDAGATRTPYQKYTMIGRGDGAVVFLDASTAVAGHPALVRASLDQHAQGGSGPTALLSKVAALPAQNQAWAVAIGGFSPLPLPDSGLMANLGQIFRRLEEASFAFDMRDGIDVDGSGLCATAEDARRLHDALRALVGLGRLNTPGDKPELLKFFDGVKVDYQERRVHLTADLPMNVLELLLSMAGPR
jgi:hypothetical protein